MTQTSTDILQHATALRRELHRQPELTWQEHETAARIRAELGALGIAWRECAETGTLATLAPEAAGRHVALRADIDALPIAETTGAAWASRVAGCMHACGHDGHTAALVATASWLKQHEVDLPGPVTLLFQPAEEGGHGAERMIQGGALEGVDVIFGWHNWPAMEFGKAVCPDGPVMAANGTFAITVRGHGGHASQPELCRDPVLAASAINLALQQVVSRRFPPQAAVVLSVTSIDAPSFDTVIPSTARLSGSFRLSDSELRETMHALITEVSEHTARAYGTEAQVELFPRYGATVNDADAAAEYRDVLRAELGEAWLCEETRIPIMASEDFSYYLEKIPGAFALIGANDGPDHAHACHNSAYDFNDALLEPLLRIYARLAGVPVS